MLAPNFSIRLGAYFLSASAPCAQTHRTSGLLTGGALLLRGLDLNHRPPGYEGKTDPLLGSILFPTN